MIRLAIAAIVLTGLPLSSLAQERQTLGWGRLFSNDVIGDLEDRWHSGSYTISLLSGPEWNGELPGRPGAILEYRLSGSTVTPANLTNPAADDRQYVAPLSLGVHTYFAQGGIETSLGADLVAIGPQTGVGAVQSWLHGILNAPKPDLSNQIGNGIFPTLQAELGRPVDLNDQMTLRPYVAAQAGVETLVRAGGDLVIGSFGKGGLLLRDDTTGQRYRGIQGDTTPALSFTLGGDVAHVFNSALLPENGPVTATETRTRLRAGVAWQGQKYSAFYGVTYLSPEFETQPEGQVIGSVSFNFRF